MNQDPQLRTVPERDAWLSRIRKLRLAGYTLDEARAIAGPMPDLSEYQLDQLADRITFGILLACVAELGPTRRAVAAAFAAVALSGAFEEESHAAVRDPR
jgi:hypothetical protein